MSRAFCGFRHAYCLTAAAEPQRRPNQKEKEVGGKAIGSLAGRKACACRKELREGFIWFQGGRGAGRARREARVGRLARRKWRSPSAVRGSNTRFGAFLTREAARRPGYGFSPRELAARARKAGAAARPDAGTEFQAAPLRAAFGGAAPERSAARRPASGPRVP